MGYSEVKEYNTINTSLDKTADGEVLAYKVGHQYVYPYLLLSVDSVKDKTEFEVFLKKKGYLIRTLKGMVDKSGYMVYLKTPVGDLQLGNIEPSKLLLLKDSEVFKDFTICAYLDSETCIDGDMLYALV